MTKGFEAVKSSEGEESPRGVVTNVLDCDIGVSKFEFQSHYYVHFQSNTLGKGVNSFIFPAMGVTY